MRWAENVVFNSVLKITRFLQRAVIFGFGGSHERGVSRRKFWEDVTSGWVVSFLFCQKSGKILVSWRGAPQRYSWWGNAFPVKTILLILPKILPLGRIFFQELTQNTLFLFVFLGCIFLKLKLPQRQNFFRSFWKPKQGKSFFFQTWFLTNSLHFVCCFHFLFFSKEVSIFLCSFFYSFCLLLFFSLL